MPGKLAAPDPLSGDEKLALTSTLISKSLFPNPTVVAQFSGPVLPSVRGNTALGPRGTVIDLLGSNVLLDDNRTPRWALLVAHGFAPNYPTGSRGWSLAHMWSRSQCKQSYTHLANLALVPLRLSSLTDHDGPASEYLKFHAWTSYGWRPPETDPPMEPSGYSDLRWRYLPEVDNAAERIEAFLRNSSNDWAKKLAALGRLIEITPQSPSSS